MLDDPIERDNQGSGVGLPDGIEALIRTQRRRGMRIVVSDFLTAGDEEIEEIAGKYRAGGYGYGHAKARLTELINEAFAEARERYEKLSADGDYVRDVLRDGGRKAREVAEATMDRVRQAAGIATHR